MTVGINLCALKFHLFRFYKKYVLLTKLLLLLSLQLSQLITVQFHIAACPKIRNSSVKIWQIAIILRALETRVLRYFGNVFIHCFFFSGFCYISLIWTTKARPFWFRDNVNYLSWRSGAIFFFFLACYI